MNSKTQQAIVDNNLAGEPASDQAIAMIKPVKFVIVGSTLYLKNAKLASGNIVIKIKK